MTDTTVVTGTIINKEEKDEAEKKKKRRKGEEKKRKGGWKGGAEADTPSRKGLGMEEDKLNLKLKIHRLKRKTLLANLVSGKIRKTS